MSLLRTNYVKKGFSLIEILVVMSIIIILFSCSISLVTVGKRITGEISSQTMSIEIVDFISSCIHYCNENGVSGYIICDKKANTIKFICNTHLVYKVPLPKSFILEDLNANNGMIMIDSNHWNPRSDCSIIYEDINNKVHKITIRVGTSYVEIKA